MINIRWQDVSKDTIIDLYFDKKLSQRDVAEILEIGQTSVRRILNKYGLKSRTPKESKETPLYKEKNKKLAERYSKEYLLDRKNICQYCNNFFPVNHKTKNNKFCSSECRIKHKNEQRKKYYCTQCGDEIVRQGNRNYPIKYCKNCAKTYPWISKDRVTVRCGYCGNKIDVIKSRAKNNKYCYCNVDCMAKHYSKIYSGENSSTWKGGKSHHYTGGFYHQRQEARKRDNFKCQLCGINEDDFGQQMSVHHIKSYRKFKNKEEANQLENLVCLCEKCHRYIHSNLNVDNKFLKE